MTQENLEKLIERNMQPENESVATEIGLQAAEIVAAAAAAARVECALAGGLAMQLYGFVRATKDVDFVAANRLPLNAVRQLGFGGETYAIKVGRREIVVDWIVRRDEYAGFYRAALADAILLNNKWRILTPEWLAILKYIAGRGKDEIDLIWLLQQKDIINRQTMREHLIRVVGDIAGKIVYRELARRYFALADGGGEGDENESYRQTEKYD